MTDKQELVVENEKLKHELASANEKIDALHLKFDGCPHTVALDVGKDDVLTCGCSYDHPSDVCAFHAPQLAEAQRERDEALANLERLSKPVSDKEMAIHAAHYVDKKGAECLIAARIKDKGEK